MASSQAAEEVLVDGEVVEQAWTTNRIAESKQEIKYLKRNPQHLAPLIVNFLLHLQGYHLTVSCRNSPSAAAGRPLE